MGNGHNPGWPIRTMHKPTVQPIIIRHDYAMWAFAIFFISCVVSLSPHSNLIAVIRQDAQQIDKQQQQNEQKKQKTKKLPMYKCT